MQTSTDTTSLANRGYLAAFGATLFLATTAIFIRYLTLNYQMPALVLTYWRELFVALSLLAVLLFTQRDLIRVERRNLPMLIVYGFVLMLFNSTWALSVALNGAAVATVLAYSSAAFTALLGWLLLKESLDLPKVIAVLMSIAGLALVSNALDQALWALNAGGVLAGVLSGLSYALYSLMGRYSSQRGVNPWTSLLYIFAIGSVFMLAANLGIGRFLPGGARTPADMFWLGDAWVGWLVLLVLAMVPTLMGFGLYNVSLHYLPSSVANLILTSEPIVTSVIAYFMFGEMLTPIQILGAALILSGVVLIRLTRKE
jgi:drug/metabolite transporter (DMT)-like permease